MSEINMTSLEYFKSQQDDLIPVVINGISTYVLDKTDSYSGYLAIPPTDITLSMICTQTILGHYIKSVNYLHHNKDVAVIIARY